MGIKFRGSGRVRGVKKIPQKIRIGFGYSLVSPPVYPNNEYIIKDIYYNKCIRVKKGKGGVISKTLI